MNRYILRFPAIIIFIAITLLSWNQCHSTENEKSPLIYIDQNKHTFPTAIGGGTLSHTFTVYNQGEADLKIKEVTHA